VGFDNGFTDGQAHANATCSILLLLIGVEYHLKQVRRNSRTLILYVDLYHVVAPVNGKGDSGLWRRILGGIVNQITKDLKDSIRVGTDLEGLFGQFNNQDMAGGQRLEPWLCQRQNFVYEARLSTYAECARFEAGGF
jgi:hypothetical protein